MTAKKTTKTNKAASKAVSKTSITKSSKSTLAKSKPITAKTSKSKSANSRKPKPERTDVFVSYSHADKDWLARLQVHLKPLERDHKVIIWTDTKLRGGDKWRTEIDNALNKAKAAVLLVSANFMASDFIVNNELPPLLEAAEKEGVLILSVIVGQSGGFTISNLSHFQTMNGPSQPLNLMSQGQVDQVLTQVFTRIYEFFIKQKNPVSKVRNPLKVLPNRSEKILSVEKTSQIQTVVRQKKTPTTQPKENKALLVKQTGDWEVVTFTQSSISNELALTLKATTPQQRAFLTSLRKQDQLSSIVLSEQTYICTNIEIHQKTEGTKETWHLNASLKPLGRKAQVNFSNVTPDMQAEVYAKLLLLNTALPENQSYYYRAGSLAASFNSSIFPTLFHQFGKQSAGFKQAASLIAIWYLQVNDIVEHVLQLTLTLKGQYLTVCFRGQRSSQFPNDKPAIIEIKGTCDLSKSEADNVLRLGPINRY